MDSNNNNNNNSRNSLSTLDNISVDSSDLNPVTTEHLKLFNPTFKKKRGPPKKVTIIDPQEFKKPEKAIESVVNNNLSHEILPDLRNMTPGKIKSMINNVSDEIQDGLFDSLNENMTDKEANSFYNSVEVLLREIKFQEEFINPHIIGFSLSGENKKRYGNSIELQNYRPIEDELSPEQYQVYLDEQSEIKKKAEILRLELEKEVNFQAQRRQIEYLKEQEEQREKRRILNEKAIEFEKKLKIEIEKKREEAILAERERLRIEEEKKIIDENARIERIKAAEAAYKHMVEQEEAKIASIEAEKAANLALRKKKIEDEWEANLKNIIDLNQTLENQKKAREIAIEKQKERIEAENAAKIKKQHEELAERKANFELRMAQEAERNKQIAIEKEKIITERKEKAEQYRNQQKQLIEKKIEERKRLKEEREKRQLLQKQQEEEIKEKKIQIEKKRLEELKLAEEKSKKETEEKIKNQMEKYRERIEKHKKSLAENEARQEKFNQSINNQPKEKEIDDSELKIRKSAAETTHNFHGLSAEELTNLLSVFNFDFYREHYKDAVGLNIGETLKHYLTKGKEENRIISLRHAQFITGVPDFDILFYKQNNPDLHELSLRELCVHFLNNGKAEGREYKEDMYGEKKTLATESSWEVNTVFSTDHEDWSRSKICIIYAYYEKPNSTKNQDNLAYFLKFGMNKLLWRKMNIKLLLIINGVQCEVDIPKQDNIVVWRKSYSNDIDGRDIGTYRQGIEFLEKKYKKTFYDKFDYLFILNSSATGPFTQPRPDYHWLDPYIEKMEIENSVICSPVINFLKPTDAGGPGPRCQTYCSLIRMTADIYSALLFTPISRSPSDTTNHSCADLLPTHACVLDKHRKTSDVILFGEYGLTRVLLDSGYNISCLIYDNLDYHDKYLWKKYSDRVDRQEDYQIRYFDKNIFIKNNWVVGNTPEPYRDSLPVLHENTNKKIHQYLSWIDIFQWHGEQIIYDYSVEHFPASGQYKIGNIINANNIETDLIGHWTNKQDYYRLFGDSEGMIRFPKINNFASNVVIYTHHDPNGIVRDYVVTALKSLMIMGFEIIFNTTQRITNVSLPFSIHVHDISEIISVPEKHAVMFSRSFLGSNFSKYSHIFYINSTYVLPLHGIENAKNVIETSRTKADFWMMYDTRGIINNNTCIEISKKCVPAVRQLLITLSKTKVKSMSQALEIDLPYALINHGFRFHSVNQYPNLSNFQSILRTPECFTITLHNLYMFVIQGKFVIKNPVLRFILRYLNLDDFKFVEMGTQ